MKIHKLSSFSLSKFHSLTLKGGELQGCNGVSVTPLANHGCFSKFFLFYFANHRSFHQLRDTKWDVMYPPSGRGNSDASHQISNLPCLELTARPSKMNVGRRSFPFGIRPIFRGDMKKLPGAKFLILFG